MPDREYNELDLQKAWQKMAEEKFSNFNLEKHEIMKAIQQTSTSNIANLRKGLKYKIGFALGFAVLFIVLVFINRADQKDMLFCAALCLSYFMVSFFMYSTYKKISKQPLATENIISEMKKNLAAINATLKVERIWGMFTFLFLFGYYTLMNLEATSGTLGIFIKIAVLAILFSIIMIGADKMNEKRFGKTIKKLESDIIRLETLK